MRRDRTEPEHERKGGDTAPHRQSAGGAAEAGGLRQHQEAHGRTGGADRLQPHAARTVSRTEAAPGFAAQPIPRQPRHGQDHGLQDIRGAAARGGSALERTRRGVRPRHLHRHALGRRGKGYEASGGNGAGRRPDD